MDVYIVVDVEGMSGISTGGLTQTGHREWVSRGRQLATAEVNAAIDGALASGAKRIWVADCHDNGETLLREELRKEAELISKPGAVAGHLPGLDDSFDALFLIGFHARIGTPHALFDHSVSTAMVNEIRLNGTVVGEIGIYAAYAGVFGIPVALVTGDTAGVQEAVDLLGDMETVAVKEAYGRFCGRIPSPEVTHPQIRAAARKALESKGRPWELERPLHVGLDFFRSAEADMAEMVPGSVRSGARTVEYTHDDPGTAFKGLQAMLALGGVAASRWAQALYKA